jgi:hypothetical protein
VSNTLSEALGRCEHFRLQEKPQKLDLCEPKRHPDTRPGLFLWRGSGDDDGAVALSFLYTAFGRQLQLVRLSRNGQQDLAIEIVMLHHEVAVLRSGDASGTLPTTTDTVLIAPLASRRRLSPEGAAAVQRSGVRATSAVGQTRRPHSRVPTRFVAMYSARTSLGQIRACRLQTSLGFRPRLPGWADMTDPRDLRTGNRGAFTELRAIESAVAKPLCGADANCQLLQCLGHSL